MPSVDADTNGTDCTSMAPVLKEKLRPSDAGDAAALYSKLYHDEKRKRESLERELTEARIYNREAFDRIKALEAAQSAMPRSERDDVGSFLEHAHAFGMMSDQAFADEVKRAASPVVEKYIAGLKWSESATEHEKAIVAGNLRTFWTWLHVNSRGRIYAGHGTRNP